MVLLISPHKGRAGDALGAAVGLHKVGGQWAEGAFYCGVFVLSSLMSALLFTACCFLGSIAASHSTNYYIWHFLLDIWMHLGPSRKANRCHTPPKLDSKMGNEGCAPASVLQGNSDPQEIWPGGRYRLKIQLSKGMVSCSARGACRTNGIALRSTSATAACSASG